MYEQSSSALFTRSVDIIDIWLRCLLLSHVHSSTIHAPLSLWHSTSLLVDPLHDGMNHGLELLFLLLQLLELCIWAALEEPQSAVADVLNGLGVIVGELGLELLVV